MKSYLFETADDRGGVILCDVDTLEGAVAYLKNRFEGVVKVQQGRDYWSETEGLCFENPSNEPPTEGDSA